MCTPARASHGALGGSRGAFALRRRRGQALGSGVLPEAGELPQSSSKMAALLAVNSGKRDGAVRYPRGPTGGAGLVCGERSCRQAVRRARGREFVRRACSRRVPARRPALPRFEWRAARLRLCRGNRCLKRRRGGGVSGSQARDPEPVSSPEYPSDVGRPTIAKVRLESRAGGPAEAGMKLVSKRAVGWSWGEG